MNVMIVSDTFPPDINGVARTLQTLARGLARLGHRVQVLTTTDGALSENAAHDVVVRKVPAVPMPGYDGIRMGLVTRGGMEQKMREHQTDAMYVAVESLMGLNAVRAARLLEVPVVSGFHTNFHTYTSDYRMPLMKNVAAAYMRYVHNRTARTLTPSESTAQQLRELGIENVGVLGRGVDTELFSPARRDESLRREWQAGPETPVAIFVGRIAPEKNLPLAVKAFTQIQQKMPGAKCVFVGSGPVAAALKAEHPEFIHAGAKTGEDLARFYASADLFVFPSLSETFGNVLTEALASGLVTVSFDYAAAHQHVRHGQNGFVAALGDENAFLSAVDEALTHFDDPSLRLAARETANKLSWNAIIEQFEHELQAPGLALKESPNRQPLSQQPNHNTP
jgi:glycosyltransferase involved in cell wall biosynthesis